MTEYGRPKAPVHNRMKPKLGKMNAKEQEYAAWITSKGCQVPMCGKSACFHHSPFKGQCGASHDLGVALCPYHHQDGKMGIHNGLGSAPLFLEIHGIDLIQVAIDNWREYNER